MDLNFRNITLALAFGVTASLVQAAPNIRPDVNGDGKSDLIWPNTSTGQVAAWLMNGTTVSASNIFAQVPSPWSIQDVQGDYNGDGKSDLLWRNAGTGEVSVWTLNGTSIAGRASLGIVPLQWALVNGHADFDGDGKSDLLWYNASSGAYSVWTMNGLAAKATAVIGTVPAPWVLVDSSGDYNGDGKADLLWWNSATGQVSVWLMNGTAVTSKTLVASVPTQWRIVNGHADYDGDGKADILWHNTATNDYAVWTMNGAAQKAVGIVGNVPSDWSIVDSSGDYNGDGKADLLWRSASTGTVAVWTLNGTTQSGAAILGVVPVQWQVLTGHADFNGDGKNDLLWQDVSTGQYAVWLMNGLTASAQTIFATVPAPWNVLEGGGSGNTGSGGTGGVPGGGWIPFFGSPHPNTTGGQTALYVLPFNLATSQPQVLTPTPLNGNAASAGFLPTGTGSFSLANLAYAAADTGGNVHAWGALLTPSATPPMPVQLSSFSAPLSSWCGAGGNSAGQGSGAIGAASTNLYQASSLFAVVETAGNDGTCFTSDDVYQVIHFTDSPSTAPVTISISPSFQQNNLLPVYGSTGALRGLLLFDTSKNLYLYPDASFSSHTTLIPGAVPITVGSTPLPASMGIRGEGLSFLNVPFLEVADGSGVQYVYSMNTGISTPTVTKVYTAAGVLGGSAVADATNVYFTDTVVGMAGSSTIKIVSVPRSGAASPTVVLTLTTTIGESVALIGSDGTSLAYLDQTVIPSLSSAIKTVPVGGGSVATIATLAGSVSAFMFGPANGAPSYQIFVNVSATTVPAGTTYSTQVLTMAGSVVRSSANSLYVDINELTNYPNAIFQITGITDTNGAYGGGTLNLQSFATGANTAVNAVPASTPFVVPAGDLLFVLSGLGGLLVNVSSTTVPYQGAVVNAQMDGIVTFGVSNTDIQPIF